MPVSPAYRAFILEQLGRATSRPVRARSMFGGVGLYAGAYFFALIDDNTLYFKVDDTNRPDFEAAEMGPFRPYGAEAPPMSYYQIPADVLEDTDRLGLWVEKAVDVAKRSGAGKKRRRS